MSKNNREWIIVHDADLDDGTPTEWSLQVAPGVYYWIDMFDDDKYCVISRDAESILVTCKSLRSAKRWVSIHILPRYKEWCFV